MKYEKIIKRKNGSRVKIVCSLYVELFRNEYRWEAYSYYCEPGKRLFKSLPPVLNPDIATPVTAATPEELLEVKVEFWNQIKPTI